MSEYKWEPEWKQLRDGSYQLTLFLGKEERRAINEALTRRMMDGPVSPVSHKCCSYTGRTLAEICREWTHLQKEMDWESDQSR